jgi:hypothetical protein
MAEQRLVVADVQKRVHDPTVAYIYLRRFDQTLSDRPVGRGSVPPSSRRRPARAPVAPR